jgi:hypothetical protein
MEREKKGEKINAKFHNQLVRRENATQKQTFVAPDHPTTTAAHHR